MARTAGVSMGGAPDSLRLLASALLALPFLLLPLLVTIVPSGEGTWLHFRCRILHYQEQ